MYTKSMDFFNDRQKTGKLSETIKNRALPTPPLEDTYNSSLINESNLKESRQMIDNLFQSNRLRGGVSINEDSKVFRGDKSQNSFQEVSKEDLGYYLANFNYALNKIIEQVDGLEQAVRGMNMRLDGTETGKESEYKDKIIICEREAKKIVEKSSDIQKRTEELARENNALKIDKQMLMDLVKKMVDQNEDNINIINSEFYNSQDMGGKLPWKLGSMLNYLILICS